MHEVIDGVAHCTVNNALYAFDGTTHIIDGFARETRSVIQAKLAEHGTNNNTNNPQYLSKGWILTPATYLQSLRQFRRTIGPNRDAHEAACSARKRQHDSEEQAIEDMKPRKRIRKDAAHDTTATLLSSVTPSRQTHTYQEVKVEAEDNVEEEEEASTEGKAEAEAAETRWPARGAIWEEQWSKTEAFRRRQRLLTAVGMYALSCSLIEDRYPGHEGQLRLSVELIPVNDDTGVLHGQLDLGLFTGAVSLAVSNTAL
ncbi:hypothetical protein BKA63DRAFT_571135 [Paraphoma chrysanthemicola]|nr:hypothetical protein BKA63DRAFT_571135 [Paraphoma chrysanthemicola]